MIGNTLRKILVALIIIGPVVTSTDCKKQAKCGCGKDVLFTLTKAPAYVYFKEDASVIYFQSLDNQLSTYYFCNPSEMLPYLKDAKSGDILQVSGYVYWDCNYVYQSSNSSYSSMYKVYQVQVTELTLDLYGKKSDNTANTPL